MGRGEELVFIESKDANFKRQTACKGPYEMTLEFARGGYSQKIWVGVCGPLPKTLTLFMTKICDIPYPIYDLTKNSKPYL